MTDDVKGPGADVTRVATARSGPFTFQLGVAWQEIETLLLRIGDAHDRFRGSLLSQVADRLEKEVVVSSIFGTNSIEGGSLSEHETQLALELDPGKVRDIEQRRALNLKTAYDLSREATANKEWRLSTTFIRSVHAAITDQLPHTYNQPGMLRDNAKTIVTHVLNAGAPILLAELRKAPWYTAMYDKRTDKTKQRDLSRLREKGLVIVDGRNRLWPGCVTPEEVDE